MKTKFAKFISQRGEEPNYSTEDYWAKFTFHVTGKIKMEPDKLIGKEKAQTLSDEDKLDVKICKGAFLLFRDNAIAKTQLKNPKEKVYLKNLGWIKKQWEENWKPNKNIIETLNNLMNCYRDKSGNVLQHWYNVGKSLAICNFDQMEAKKIEEEIHVAVFLNTVKAPNQAKKFWEKRDDRAELEKLVKTLGRSRQRTKESTRKVSGRAHNQKRISHQTVQQKEAEKGNTK